MPRHVQEDDIFNHGFKDRRNSARKSSLSSQDPGDGGSNDVAMKRMLRGNPSKCPIPYQQTNGCCGDFGGDLSKGGLWWTSGCCSIVGRREKQEDRYCVIPRYDELIGGSEGSNGELTRAGFFGIYDGHCGTEAAQFVADELHTRLAQKVRMGIEPQMAVTETFLELDNQV